MTVEEYHASDGLSNSGLKHLAVSPFRYWHQILNPNRPPDEPTSEMVIGTALHTAVLEPAEFDKRYVCKLDKNDYHGCLDTMDELKKWLSDRGLPTSAKRKRELVERVALQDPSVPILELLEEKHDALHAGKLQFKSVDWWRIGGMAHALRSEPRLVEILDSGGQTEVAMFAKDPETGVLLKARLDFASDTHTVDLKTFSQQRGNSIDKSVANAIYYERYYVQAYWYGFVRSLQDGFVKPGVASLAPPFVMAFVESEEPYEVRLRSLLPKFGGEVNLYWERARLECRDLVRLYADCLERYGDKPWRSERDIDPLEDRELPGLAF